MKRYLSLLAVLFATSATAETIAPKANIELLFIDEVKVLEKRSESEITSGPSQVVIRYSNTLKDSGKKRLFDSEPFVLSFEAPDSDLEILAPKLYSYSQANAHFNGNPEWKLITEDGVEVPYTQEVLDRGEGVFPYYDLPKLIKDHNAKRGVVIGKGAAIAAAAQDANASIVTTTESGKKEVVKLETTNVDQLKAWYFKASKQERKEFRKWMIDQE